MFGTTIHYSTQEEYTERLKTLCRLNGVALAEDDTPPAKPRGRPKKSASGAALVTAEETFPEPELATTHAASAAPIAKEVYKEEEVKVLEEASLPLPTKDEVKDRIKAHMAKTSAEVTKKTLIEVCGEYQLNKLDPLHFTKIVSRLNQDLAGL